MIIHVPFAQPPQGLWWFTGPDDTVCLPYSLKKYASRFHLILDLIWRNFWGSATVNTDRRPARHAEARKAVMAPSWHSQRDKIGIKFLTRFPPDRQINTLKTLWSSRRMTLSSTDLIGQLGYFWYSLITDQEQVRSAASVTMVNAIIKHRVRLKSSFKAQSSDFQSSCQPHSCYCNTLLFLLMWPLWPEPRTASPVAEASVPSAAHFLPIRSKLIRWPMVFQQTALSLAFLRLFDLHAQLWLVSLRGDQKTFEPKKFHAQRLNPKIGWSP